MIQYGNEIPEICNHTLKMVYAYMNSFLVRVLGHKLRKLETEREGEEEEEGEEKDTFL